MIDLLKMGLAALREDNTRLNLNMLHDLFAENGFDAIANYIAADGVAYFPCLKSPTLPILYGGVVIDEPLWWDYHAYYELNIFVDEWRHMFLALDYVCPEAIDQVRLDYRRFNDPFRTEGKT